MGVRKGRRDREGGREGEKGEDTQGACGQYLEMQTISVVVHTPLTVLIMIGIAPSTSSSALLR